MVKRKMKTRCPLVGVVVLGMWMLSACGQPQTTQTASPVVTPGGSTTAQSETAPTQPEAEAPANRPLRIGTTQIVSHPALDDSLKGFQEEMATLGFSEGKDVIYDVQNAQGDMGVNASIAQKFATDKVDLIVAIATPSAQAAVKATEGTDIPVLFLTVTAPAEAGLVPNPRVTGVSDIIPVARELELALEILPNAKRIGVVYNSGEVNSQVQLAIAREVAPKLNVSLVEATATNSSEVLTAAQSLVGRVDLIWVPADNTAVAALESIVKVGNDNRILVLGSDASSVERGAAAGVGFEYSALGRQGAHLAATILRDGVAPGSIEWEPAHELSLAVNLPAAAAQGITLPAGLVERADKVFK